MPIKPFPPSAAPSAETFWSWGGTKAMAAAEPKLREALKTGDFHLDFLKYGDNCTYENIDRIAAQPVFQKADMVFGVGGGRALDTAKTLCDKYGKYFFTLPTIASTCAASTSVAVIYDEITKEFCDVYFCKRPALHVFIDTEIITCAPYIYMWAGIGDALSKQYESALSGRDKVLNHSNGIGVQLAGRCSEELMTYGLEALKAVKNREVTPALERTVLEIIVTTGFVSLLVDLDYNSNLAHAVYFGCTVLPQCENHLHGEIVAYGVLVMLLMDKQYDNFHRLYEFAKAAKLPTCLKDLEVETQADLDKLVARAMLCNDIKCSPYTITEEMLRSSIEELEKINRGQLPEKLVSY